MPRPSKADIQRYLDLKAHKAELEREARGLEPEIDALADKVVGHLEQLGKETARVSGFQVTLAAGNASVKWKDELARVAGAEVVAQLLRDAPRGVKIVIVPAVKVEA